MGTAQEVFQTRGALLARGLLDSEWIELLRDVADDIFDSTFKPTDRLAGAAEAPARASDGMWRRNEHFARFLQQSPIADAAGFALGAHNVRLFEDLFLHTAAGDKGAPWHRDSPHWPIRGYQICSVWFSLEKVELDTGGLHFVAGSHHDSDEFVAGEPMTMTLDTDREQREVFGFATEPGDAIVFHPRILHSAFSGAPDHPRRTFTIRFIGDDVRWRPRSAYYHEWMQALNFQRGDELDHPWFPVVRGAVRPVATDVLGKRAATEPRP